MQTAIGTVTTVQNTPPKPQLMKEIITDELGFIKIKNFSQTWWYMSVILTHGGLGRRVMNSKPVLQKDLLKCKAFAT